MVIRYRSPNDKTGVVVPPYTREDRRSAAELIDAGSWRPSHQRWAAAAKRCACSLFH